MNTFRLEGNIGKINDPQKTSNDNLAVTFTVADNYKQGDTEKTTWFTCDAYKKTAEIVKDNLQTGDRVIIEGTVRIDNPEEGKFYTKVIVNRVSKIARLNNESDEE